MEWLFTRLSKRLRVVLVCERLKYMSQFFLMLCFVSIQSFYSYAFVRLLSDISFWTICSYGAFRNPKAPSYCYEEFALKVWFIVRLYERWSAALNYQKVNKESRDMRFCGLLRVNCSCELEESVGYDYTMFFAIGRAW